MVIPIHNPNYTSKSLNAWNHLPLVRSCEATQKKLKKLQEAMHWVSKTQVCAMVKKMDKKALNVQGLGIFIGSFLIEYPIKKRD